jgi:hypothetical protein
MNRLRCVILLQFLLQLGATLALGQNADQSKSRSLPTQPDALVRSLYTEVVARHPHDIPEGADMKIFAPYLSKALLHRIDLAKDCSADWDRENPEPHLKEERASIYGLFSGDGVEAEPRAFQIEKTRSVKDGSARVYVKLTWENPPQRPWTWRVGAVVLRENGHYVIDDVIYVNDNIYDKPEDRPADRRLSEYLSAGCYGPKWAGYSLPDQPVALVRSLYQEVVARPPVGMLSGADWKIFAPYLSKTLMHRIDLNIACGEDWHRQYPDPDLKPPVLEMGLFSGNDEKTEPRTFHIERTESETDGSFHIYVRLTHGTPNTSSWWVWHVAAILVRENGRLVVDDVIFLKDEKDESGVDCRLSESLSDGCDGPRWVGYPDDNAK